MAREDMTYEEACHAMQSGVAFDHAQGSRDGEPKFLRVGINQSLCNDAALARLLIARGIFTEAEYMEEIRRETIREVFRYEVYLSAKYGKTITLG